MHQIHHESDNNLISRQLQISQIMWSLQIAEPLQHLQTFHFKSSCLHLTHHCQPLLLCLIIIHEVFYHIPTPTIYFFPSIERTMVIRTLRLALYSPMFNFHPMVIDGPHLARWIKWHSSLNNGFMGWFPICTWVWANHWLNLWVFVPILIYGLQLQMHHSPIPPCPHLHPFVEARYEGLHNKMAPGSCVLSILHKTNRMDHPTIQGAINKYCVGPYTTQPTT